MWTAQACAFKGADFNRTPVSANVTGYWVPMAAISKKSFWHDFMKVSKESHFIPMKGVDEGSELYHF